MKDKQNYNNMSKDELAQLCVNKDAIIEKCMDELKNIGTKILNKKDIMELYGCESNKALRILKVMFQMGYGNKIGKEYYVSQKSQEDFMECMVGKDVFI